MSNASDSLVAWKQGQRKWFAYGLARDLYFGRALGSDSHNVDFIVLLKVFSRLLSHNLKCRIV